LRYVNFLLDQSGRETALQEGVWRYHEEIRQTREWLSTSGHAGTERGLYTYFLYFMYSFTVAWLTTITYIYSVPTC
jgi:hypothetical protein